MAYPNSYPPHGAPSYPPSNYPPEGAPSYRQQPQSPVLGFQLSAEEKRTLLECRQESFYRRCLPFMTALGLGTYYGVHLGYFKPHPTYAAGPKVAISMAVGFVAGQLSYNKQCEEKILRLPGGKLKEQILRSRNMLSLSDNDGGYRDASMSYASTPYTPVPFRSNEPSTASEQDTERHHDTFDDSFRIRSGDNMTDSEDLSPLVSPAQSTSYAELRYRNREEFEAKRTLRQPRSGLNDDHPPFAGGYTPTRSASDLSSRADAYQSPTAAADRLSRSHVYETPTGGFDQPHHSEELNVPNQQRAPTLRKNFYGDVIER